MILFFQNREGTKKERLRVVQFLMFLLASRIFSDIFYYFFQKSYQLASDCLLCNPVIGLDLESHSQEKVQFFETRLSDDHSRILRRGRDYILLFLYFEKRSRLRKILGCMALLDFGAKCWMGDRVECTPLETVMTTRAPTRTFC